MELNITLLFQIMQFYCAYYFLYKFLFAPAFKILNENEQVKNYLYRNLEKEQLMKDALLQTFYVKKSEFKDQLFRAIPKNGNQSLYLLPSISPILYSIDDIKLCEKDKKETENFLIDYLSRVVKK